MTPHVVHCRTTTEHYVYIGRPSIFGNPYPMSRGSDRARVIALEFAHAMQKYPSPEKT